MERERRDIVINGKVKYRLWASRSGTQINGKTFHLYPENVKSFCGMMTSHGWKIGQIKRVI